MPSTIAGWIVGLAALYLVLGLVFAIPFVLVGAGRIDPLARQGTWGFRVLILPGAAALWPLLYLTPLAAIALSLWALSRHPVRSSSGGAGRAPRLAAGRLRDARAPQAEIAPGE